MIFFFRILLIVVGVIIALIALISTLGDEWLNRAILREIDQLKTQARKHTIAKAKLETLETLPVAIQRYLVYAQILNKPIPTYIHMTQSGNFRKKQGANWMSFRATQYFTIDPPGFLWHAKMKMAPFITLTVRDKFLGGKGGMQAKILSAIKVVDEETPVIDQGALVRYLGEMVWFPYSFLSPYITWKSFDNDAAQATLTVGELKVSGTFYINDVGAITHFEADRMRSEDGKATSELYVNKYSAYHVMGGCRIPTEGEAGWDLKSGYFSYVTLQINDMYEAIDEDALP